MRRSPERGQAVPLLAAVLVVAAAVALVLVDLGVAAVSRAQARTAADAAALAGAADGESGARAVAEANGAELLAFSADGPVVEVTVRVGGAIARATAEGLRPHLEGVPHGVTPAVAAALARAAQLLGGPVAVVGLADGGRTVQVDPAGARDLLAVAPEAGLCRQTAPARPVHFAVCPPSPAG